MGRLLHWNAVESADRVRCKIGRFAIVDAHARTGGGERAEREETFDVERVRVVSLRQRFENRVASLDTGARHHPVDQHLAPICDKATDVAVKMAVHLVVRHPCGDGVDVGVGHFVTMLYARGS